MATNPTDAAGLTPLERVPTGIPGLDTILRGGFLRAGIYIVRGQPGTGKTILGNQFCFNHIATGHHAVYVTLLAETHDRMMQHMQVMSFFDPTGIPDGLYYVNGFRVLEEEGLKGFINLVRHEIRTHEATLLVLDGLIAAEESSQSEREFKKFIHELQAHIAIEGCTGLLLTNGRRNTYHPEHTMVDGLIELHDVLFGTQAEREIEVHKLRGTDALRGRHPFRITGQGIIVFPRIEALLARPSGDDQWPDERCPTGVGQLDKMIGGGIPRGTTTLVLGALGSGKTSLGLHFLSQSSAEEPGLFFGFYETPLRLRVKAAGIGVALDRLIEQGRLEILWHPPTEDILDALGNRLIEAMRRRRVKRLVIDGLLGFEEFAADRPHRIGRFLTALANELRALNVTTFYTAETRNLIGGAIEGPTIGLSTIAENLILLRYVEIRSQLRRLISVVKMRDSDFDSSLREFRITGRGYELAETFHSAEAILSGFPQTDTRGTDRGQRGSASDWTVIMPTVLVVDDEFGIVDVLETILIDEAYRVLTACNGKQGLERLATERPDVVLLDFMMPILGGAEMLAAMAAEPAYRHIPVIMISSLGENALAEKCTGYVAYLRKPFRATAVLSTIARVLEGRAHAGIS